MIEENGVYDIPEDEYHKDPCLTPSASCSILQTIDERSPLHAMWDHPRYRLQEEENEVKYNFGSAFHRIMTGRGREIEAIDVPDWRGKDARTMRDTAHANGKIPMKLDDYERLLTMCQETNIQLGDHEGWDCDWEYEKSLIWKVGDHFFRCRPDCMDREKDIMADFKATETSAAPESFERHIFAMGYDFRAAYYSWGYQQLTGRPLKEYRFVACEVDAPHALSVFSLTPEAISFAMKRVERAVDLWKNCSDKNQWPGYTKKICYLNPPKWRENKQIEREILEEGEQNVGLSQ